jgi:hypothetical protein
MEPTPDYKAWESAVKKFPEKSVADAGGIPRRWFFCWQPMLRARNDKIR